jgi:hypothetical protein
MKSGGLSLIRVAKLLGISVAIVLVLLYVDYQYGLRITPKTLTRQSKTEHFHIYTDIEDASLDYYEDFFEGFYDYVNREYFEIGQKRPLKVYLFKGMESYGPFVEKTRGLRTPYGFYMGPWVNIIVVNRESGLGTVTHELVHHFTRTSFKRRPAIWAYEGIATFFEKFIGHIDENGKLIISFGYFSNWRFPLIKAKQDSLSIDELIESRQPDQSQARALMLFLHKKGLFKEFVRQLKVQKNDPTGALTLQKVYGKDILQIQYEWKNWVRQQTIDENIKLVEKAFVLPAKEWETWWSQNSSRLYWDENQQIYRVRKSAAQTRD